MSALEQAMAEPSLEDRLREALPSWTHWSGSIFGGFTATWTTTAGTWSIGTSGMSPWPALEGPGGKWVFGSKGADHIIGVLRALDAIPGAGPLVDHNPETYGPGGRCTYRGPFNGYRGCLLPYNHCEDHAFEPAPGTGSADPDGGQ